MKKFDVRAQFVGEMWVGIEAIDEVDAIEKFKKLIGECKNKDGELIGGLNGIGQPTVCFENVSFPSDPQLCVEELNIYFPDKITTDEVITWEGIIAEDLDENVEIDALKHDFESYTVFVLKPINYIFSIDITNEDVRQTIIEERKIPISLKSNFIDFVKIIGNVVPTEEQFNNWISSENLQLINVTIKPLNTDSIALDSALFELREIDSSINLDYENKVAHIRNIDFIHLQIIKNRLLREFNIKVVVEQISNK